MLMSPPLEQSQLAGKGYIVTDHRINTCYTMTPFNSEERVLETPAPMPIDCVLGTDTPSPSNHSSSPPMDASEILFSILQTDDQPGTIRKRKASNEMIARQVQKRHRRTKAEINAAKLEMLKKHLKPCSVNAVKVDVTRADASVRIFHGRSTQEIRKNLPRVPRWKIVPEQLNRIDEIGFMLTQKGIIFSCMTACNFKTYDSATFSNHLIKFHGMSSNKQSAGGKMCHTCFVHHPKGSLFDELKHICDHFVRKKEVCSQEILYSTVKNSRNDDSDEDSDAYEDEDEEAVARAPSVCKSEPNVQETQEQSGATETAEHDDASVDDSVEQPLVLDEETSKVLEDVLKDCLEDGLFDDLPPGDFNLNDSDFEPEQEPQTEQKVHEEARTSSEEEGESEDYYSCEGDNEDREDLITPDASRKSRKIRSDRKRAARQSMQALVNSVNEKRQRKQLASESNESPTGDKENKDPSAEEPKEITDPEGNCTRNTEDSEDEIIRPINAASKTRIDSSDEFEEDFVKFKTSDDESDTKQSSASSSRRSSKKSRPSRVFSDKDTDDSSSSGDSTATDDIPTRNSPILTRRRVSRTSKDCASDSPAKFVRGRILDFPARPSSQSDDEPATSTRATSKRRRKIVSGLESDSETESPPIDPETKKSPEKASSSSDADETLRPTKVEVKTESSADLTDESKSEDGDTNFLDSMPPDMAMKIHQTLMVRHTTPANKPEEPLPEATSSAVVGENSGTTCESVALKSPANSSKTEAQTSKEQPNKLKAANPQSASSEITSKTLVPENSSINTVPELTKESSVSDTSPANAPLSAIAGCFPQISDALSQQFLSVALGSLTKELSLSPPARSVRPTASPQPPPTEENNNEQISGKKVQVDKILTVAERYKQMEKKIFKVDRRKTRTKSPQPTARKSTSRSQQEDVFPKEGTEAFKRILENFRIRNFSIELTRAPVDESEKKKEPLKIKIINASNVELARVESAEEPVSQPEESPLPEVSDPPESRDLDPSIDDSMIEIIQPVPDVPYNSQEHDLTLTEELKVEAPAIVELEVEAPASAELEVEAPTSAELTVAVSTRATNKTKTTAKKPAAETSKLKTAESSKPKTVERAGTSQPKTVDQVEPPPPEDDLLEDLKDLYPWLMPEISEKWNKSSTARKAMMQENCLFSTFKCMSVYCSFFTTDQDDFKKHLEQHRGVDKFFLCSFCLSDEESPEELIDHYELRHTKDRYQCNCCMYRSAEKFYCQDHQKVHHEKKPKSILKSPMITLLKSERSKAIKKLERKLRDDPDSVAKAITCKCKFISSPTSINIKLTH